MCLSNIVIMKILAIIYCLLLPLTLLSQTYEIRSVAMDIAAGTNDSLFIKVGSDSLFRRINNTYVFATRQRAQYFTSASNVTGSNFITSAAAALNYQPIGNYLVNTDISGKLNKTDTAAMLAAYQSAINNKQAIITQGTTAQYLRGNLTLGTYTGYAINVQALTSSPVDAQTIYFGTLPKAPVTVTATSKIYVRTAGTITGAEIYCYSGTAGTAENWSIYIRVNNTTDYLISTVGLSTSERIFTNNALSITLSAGDYFEIKAINPTWVTNPLTVIFSGYVKIN